MLYLTRKVGESIIINDTIEVVVAEIKGKNVRLGFTFPAQSTVLRKEVYEKIQQENKAASQASLGLLQKILQASKFDSHKRRDDT